LELKLPNFFSQLLGKSSTTLQDMGEQELKDKNK
jgi:hypothetical protein